MLLQMGGWGGLRGVGDMTKKDRNHFLVNYL